MASTDLEVAGGDDGGDGGSDGGESGEGDEHFWGMSLHGSPPAGSAMKSSFRLDLGAAQVRAAAVVVEPREVARLRRTHARTHACTRS